MSSYFTSILSKANEIVSSTTDTIKDYIWENPTTSALVATTGTVGGTYLFRRTPFYQRHSTVINTIGIMTAVGVGYMGYTKAKPYITNLMKAKELLEKSNSKRIVLSPEQLIAIDQTNIQSWVVTLEALRTSLLDTYNVERIMEVINSVRERQRTLRFTDAGPILPLFNHYRIHCYGRLISTLVLTSIVRYFNGVSVAVTFRYSELDRISFEQTTLNEQQLLQQEELTQKLQLHQQNPTTAPPLTSSETTQLQIYKDYYNSNHQAMYLKSLAQSGVTDVLNLIYQSTLTVLFPVICQIVTAQLMDTDVPFNYHAFQQRYDNYIQRKKNTSQTSTTTTSPSTTSTTTTTQSQSLPELIQYPPGTFFFDESWIGCSQTSQDLMLMIERATIKTMATLIQPAEWFVRVQRQQNQQQGDNTTTQTTDSTTTTTTPTTTNNSNEASSQSQTNEHSSLLSTIPITDFILGYGYGNYYNAALRENQQSRSGFSFMTPTELSSLHSFSLHKLEHLVTVDNLQRTNPSQLNTLVQPMQPHDLPIIAYKSLSSSPIIFEHYNSYHTPLTQSPLPLLSHLLLPLGPLLHSVLQRLHEMEPQLLKVLPSTIGILPTNSQQQQQNQQQQPFQQHSALSPIGDMFGLSNSSLFGGNNNPNMMNNLTNPSLPTPPQRSEQVMVLDSKEIYTRRVLQVMGELYSLITCPDVDLIESITKTNTTTSTTNNASKPIQFATPMKPEVAQAVNNAATIVTHEQSNNTIEQTKGAQIAQLLDAIDAEDENNEHLLQTVDSIDVTLHPWHYSQQGQNGNTTTTTTNNKDYDPATELDQLPYDTTSTIDKLETNLKSLPLFAEMWKDIKLLLVHVGTLLHEQSIKNNRSQIPKDIENKMNIFNDSINKNTPLYQFNSNYYNYNMLNEPQSNALVMAKRVDKLFEVLLPSLEQAQLQQQQQISLQNKQQQQKLSQPSPQQQNYSNMLLVPQSCAFHLTMSNYHRKYVLDTIMKTIAGHIGSEKNGSNSGGLTDLFGFGGEELGMLQSLLGGSGDGDLESPFGNGGPNGTGEPDLMKMLALINGTTPEEMTLLGLNDNDTDNNNNINDDKKGTTNKNKISTKTKTNTTSESIPTTTPTPATQPQPSTASKPTQNQQQSQQQSQQQQKLNNEEEMLMQSLLSALGGPQGGLSPDDLFNPAPKPKKSTKGGKKSTTPKVDKAKSSTASSVQPVTKATVVKPIQTDE